MNQKFSKVLFLITLSLMTTSLLMGCQSKTTTPLTETTSSTETSSNIDVAETKLIDAYLAAIDLVFNITPEMNTDLKYLSIDTSVLINLSENDRSQLLEGLKIYDVEVLDYSFEKLQEQGYIKDALFENGLFLKIEDTPIQDNQIQIIPSKWRSTTYAAGLSKVILTLQNNIWTVTQQGIAWLQ